MDTPILYILLQCLIFLLQIAHTHAIPLYTINSISLSSHTRTKKNFFVRSYKNRLTMFTYPFQGVKFLLKKFVTETFSFDLQFD